MDKRIAVLAGDGIGPEVVKQAIKVLDAISHRFHHNFNYDVALVGAAAIDATGDPLPDETVEACRLSDAILLVQLAIPNMIMIQLQKYVLNKDY